MCAMHCRVETEPQRWIELEDARGGLFIIEDYTKIVLGSITRLAVGLGLVQNQTLAPT